MFLLIRVKCFYSGIVVTHCFENTSQKFCSPRKIVFMTSRLSLSASHFIVEISKNFRAVRSSSIWIFKKTKALEAATAWDYREVAHQQIMPEMLRENHYFHKIAACCKRLALRFRQRFRRITYNWFVGNLLFCQHRTDCKIAGSCVQCERLLQQKTCQIWSTWSVEK